MCESNNLRSQLYPTSTKLDACFRLIFKVFKPKFASLLYIHILDGWDQDWTSENL